MGSHPKGCVYFIKSVSCVMHLQPLVNILSMDKVRTDKLVYRDTNKIKIPRLTLEGVHFSPNNWYTATLGICVQCFLSRNIIMDLLVLNLLPILTISMGRFLSTRYGNYRYLRIEETKLRQNGKWTTLKRRAGANNKTKPRQTLSLFT